MATQSLKEKEELIRRENAEKIRLLYEKLAAQYGPLSALRRAESPAEQRQRERYVAEIADLLNLDRRTLWMMKPEHLGKVLIDSVRLANPRAVQLLLLCGADINIQDEDGMSALHHAAAIGARPCLRLLIKDQWCSYLLKDKEGRYAADLALEWARDAAVSRLLTKKQLQQATALGIPAWTPL